MSRLKLSSSQDLRRSGSSGFTNQQALLVLLICFPLGLIALGTIVMVFQREVPQLAQDPQSTTQKSPQPLTQSQRPDSSTTIQPLPNSAPSADDSGLTEPQARAIVEKWLTIKSQIFAPPFNADLADETVAAGPLWTDLTKENGSIQWLQNNNSYYTYSTIRVNRVNGFSPSPSMPSIIVSVTEDSTLHSPKGSSPSSSTRDWVYILKEEEGRWKIWDYRKQ
jgi:serine/threonine-protein kinase